MIATVLLARLEYTHPPTRDLDHETMGPEVWMKRRYPHFTTKFFDQKTRFVLDAGLDRKTSFPTFWFVQSFMLDYSLGVEIHIYGETKVSDASN